MGRIVVAGPASQARPPASPVAQGGLVDTHSRDLGPGPWIEVASVMAPLGEWSGRAARWRPLGGRALRSGPAGRAGGLGGLVEFLDAGGELEVAVGQPTLGVAGEGQGDLVPADVDVGVVAGRLGRVGDLGDERDRVSEVLAHEGLEDLVAAPLPTGQALQALLDRGVVQP